MRPSLLVTIPLSVVVVIAGWCLAEDWPQYRGPNRDDVSQETGLLDQWPEEGPKLLWTYKEAGVGYSGPAIVGDRLYTLGDRGDKEFLLALDIKKVEAGTVTEQWAVELGDKFDFKGNQWSAGPSSTPTVDGDRVYALSGNGDLVCVKVTDGDVVWRKSLPGEMQAQVNPIGGGPKNLGWGFTWSPLIDGAHLICIPGGPLGTVAALDKQTGQVVWRSTKLTDQAAYTSPMIAVIDGVRQYVVLTNQGIRGIAAEDGSLLWQHDHRLGTEVVNSPILHSALVHTTVGTANGNDIIKIVRGDDGFKVEEIYSGNNLVNHHGNVVRVGDHVYGSGARQGFGCQRIDTGDIVWSDRKVPTGAVTYADGKLYCYSEGDGTVHLLEASPDACKVLSRFKIPESSAQHKPSGRIWTPPVISGGRLFLRDQELIFCYDVKQ